MFNKISRGSTGQSTESHTFCEAVPNESFYDKWSMSFDHISMGDSSNPNGFNLTQSGMMTIPSQVEIGVYSGVYTTGIFCDDGYIVGVVAIQFHAEVVCLTLEVQTSKVSSSPISGTSPQQYKHVYMARAMVEGGDTPFTYNWSTTAGAFAPSSPTGDTVRIEVINTSPSGSNVSGIVECTVTDSDSCEDTASAEFGGATGSEEGPHPCLQPILMDAGSTCSSSSTPQQCLQPTGNNIDGGSGNGQGSNPYTGGSGLAGLGVNEAGNNNGSQPNHQPGILHAF